MKLKYILNEYDKEKAILTSKKILKEGFGKSFIFSISFFCIFNFWLWISNGLMSGTLFTEFDYFIEYPGNFVVKLFYPLSRSPWAFIQTLLGSVDPFEQLCFILYLLNITVSAIIAGLFSRNLLGAIEGWTATVLVSQFFILVTIQNIFVLYDNYHTLLINDFIVEVISSGILNIVLFGFLAMLVAFVVHKRTGEKDFYFKNKISLQLNCSLRLVFLVLLIYYSLLFYGLLVVTFNLMFDMFIDIINFILINIVVYGIVFYITGLLVKHKGVRVNYTRKINHFTIFFVPQFISLLFNPLYIVSQTTRTLPILLFLAVISFETIRKRSRIFQTMFLGFDRPEDRPYTAFWLSSQILVNLIVIDFIVFLLILNSLDNIYSYTLILVMVSGIGDGLAEPIGIRFGKHKYNVKALFTEQKYTRSFEGSACVLIISLISVLIFYPIFTPPQLVIALSYFPICMTIVEAFSPHTWDNPFFFLVGGLLLFTISLI